MNTMINYVAVQCVKCGYTQSISADPLKDIHHKNINSLKDEIRQMRKDGFLGACINCRKHKFKFTGNGLLHYKTYIKYNMITDPWLRMALDVSMGLIDSKQLLKQGMRETSRKCAEVKRNVE